ncbi:hypothetical protein [Streptomyces drozdowiczii]
MASYVYVLVRPLTDSDMTRPTASCSRVTAASALSAWSRAPFAAYA